MDGLQRATASPDALEYVAEHLEKLLRRRMGGAETEHLQAKQAKIESEPRNLTDTAAQVGPSDFLVRRIAERERSAGSIKAASTASTDSVRFSAGGLWEYVTSRLPNIGCLLSVYLERTRAELARHVDRIEMRPTALNDVRYYTVAGNWSLL